MAKTKDGTVTEKELAVELGLKPEVVLSVAHGILSMISRPTVNRVIIQGFGVFTRKTTKPSMAYRALLGRDVQIGGKLQFRFKPAPLAVDWLRKTSDSDRSLLFRTGIIPELLHRNSSVLARIQRAVSEHTRVGMDEVAHKFQPTHPNFRKREDR